MEGIPRGTASDSGTEAPLFAMSAEADLTERDGELDTLAAALAGLADRVGGVVTVQAPAGLGKTTLVERATATASEAGYRVRSAAPSPQERHFAYGVIRTLLEAPVHDAGVSEQARLLDDAAGQAGDLLLGGRVPGPDATTPSI